MGERKEDIHKVRDLREHLERLRRELEEAEGNYDLNRAAELRHGKIPAIEKELKEAEEMGANNKQENRLLREEVSEEEIADIVSRWTGIPVAKLVEGEREIITIRANFIRACYRTRRSGKPSIRRSSSCSCWY